MSKNFVSLACAIACSFIWGTAFIAQDMGMDFIGPYTFSAVRLALGFLALLPFFFIFEYQKVKNTRLELKFIIGYLFLLGFFLVATLIVLARSFADIPVVIPFFASIETVKAVLFLD